MILAASLALGCGQPLKVRDVVGTWHGPDGPAYLTLSSDGTFKEDITINGNHVGNHGTFTIDGQSIRFQIESGDKATGRIDDGVLVITDPGGTTTWTR